MSINQFHGYLVHLLFWIVRTNNRIIFTMALYILFFCQHVVMALLGFKIKMAGLCHKYPLYERFIFNLSASIVFIIILHFVKPVSNLST